MYLHETVAEILDPIGSVCTTKDFQEECLEKLTDNKLGTNLKALYNEYKVLDQLSDTVLMFFIIINLLFENGIYQKTYI